MTTASSSSTNGRCAGSAPSHTAAADCQRYRFASWYSNHAASKVASATGSTSVGPGSEVEAGTDQT
jgi:hypothetical protein